METAEIVQALVSPTKKLIEAISGAIGKAYEPKHIKKMTDATAYEIKMIAEAIRNNSDVPIVYNSSKVSIDTSNYEEIAKRASNRLAYQEITKQQNIESVVDNAYKELENVNAVSNEPVNSDWMIRFFNCVEDISNEDMQKIWGRILAGEVKRPSTYSYRTLEKLKNMTQQEAEHFQQVASLALQGGGRKFILNNTDLMNKYHVGFLHFLELEECGLMTAQALSLRFNVSNGQSDYIHNSNIIGIIKGKSEEKQCLALQVYTFTESGRQLMTAIHPNINDQYILDCLALIRKNNKDFSITAHNINFVDDQGNINYDILDILPTEEN